MFHEGQQLEVVYSEKDLGVANLKVADHCQQAWATVNRMLGLVSRTVKYGNIDIIAHLYKSLVWPHLEYTTTAWNLYTNRRINCCWDRYKCDGAGLYCPQTVT